jgi:HSP20 family protein
MKNIVPWRKNKESDSPVLYGDNPFAALHHEMDRVFDHFLDSFGPLGHGPLPRAWGPAAVEPRFEVTETDDSIQVKAELPGMDQKDVEVTLDEDTLTIKGEKKEEKEQQEKNYHLSEVSYGQFRRVVALPAGIDKSKAKAAMKNGVLRLTLPKTAESRSRHKAITITPE